MTTIHAAESLLCGCRVDPQTGDLFTTCVRHACHPAMAHAELPYCVFCGSRRLAHSQSGLHLDCKDCGCRFPISEVA